MPRVVHPQKVNVIEGKIEASSLVGEHVFHVTEYVLAGEGDEWSVFRVKTGGKGLLRTVIDVQLIADESETVFVETNVDPSSVRDVLAATSRLATGKVRCIAYKAKYQHIGIALFEPPNTHVHIVEVEPPPPKLVDYANQTIREELVRRDMKFTTTTVDILNLVKEEDKLITPCKLHEVGGALSLDKDAEKIRRIQGSYTLLGCPVTLATIREVNPTLTVKLVDICPAHIARKTLVKADYYVARCCKASIQGTFSYGTRKRIVALQWSPTLEEFLEALYHGTQLL